MTSKRKLACAIASVGAIAIVGSGAIATAGSAGNSSGNKLAGTWHVTVIRPAPAPPLKSLQVFTGNGSLVEMADEWQSTRTPQFGSWQRVQGRLYAVTGEMFRFNPQTGASVGTQKINRTIQLSEDGQSFTVSGRSTVYDTNGNVVGSFPVTATGERLEIEPVG